MQKKPKVTITIERLAEMTARGFEDIGGRMATKSELENLATKSDLSGLENRLTERLDRIENILLREHLNRIERLEDSVRILKTKAGIR